MYEYICIYIYINTCTCRHAHSSSHFSKVMARLTLSPVAKSLTDPSPLRAAGPSLRRWAVAGREGFGDGMKADHIQIYEGYPKMG